MNLDSYQKANIFKRELQMFTNHFQHNRFCCTKHKTTFESNLLREHFQQLKIS